MSCIAGDSVQHPCNTTRADVSNSFNVGKSLINLAYTGDPAKIRPRRKRNWIFRRGELARLVHDIEREATKPLHRDDVALEILNHKGWTCDPDLLETVAEKVKDVRKRSAAT